ncbi:MAG: hypothetical protein ACLQUT_02620 [Thermoleophilia bacterium]
MRNAGRRDDPRPLQLDLSLADVDEQGSTRGEHDIGEVDLHFVNQSIPQDC